MAVNYDDFLALDLPDILKFKNGEAVTKDNWNLRRKEIIDILSEYEFGYSPKACKATGNVLESNDNMFAGKVKHHLAEISFDTENGPFSFPLNVYIPKDIEKPQLILYISFKPDIPNKYFPLEEIADNSFAAAIIYYNDITYDNLDLRDGLAGKFFNNGTRKNNDCGKIGLWAYAASRALDYLVTLDEIDTSRISVAGHSRLGKTALWASAQDERFYCGISNESGCAGAAIARLPQDGAEPVEAIVRRFDYWFCRNYYQFSENESAMPFDQHFLVAASAPRKVYVCDASGDRWANPIAEYLSCVKAAEVYKMLGFENNLPEFKSTVEPPYKVHGGQVGYHIRTGIHFLSRYDWNRYFEFLR